MARNALIQIRRDTAANWTSANPTLAAGEMGFETDTGKLKIGTGSTAWNSLLYATDASDITGSFPSLTVTGNVVVDTNTLYVDATNNRVGVGTASPNAKLDIATTSGESITAMVIVNEGTGYTLFAADSSSDSTPFVIDSTGNVGVGTFSPTAKLDVQVSSGTAMRITNSGSGESFRVEDATGDITPFVIDASGNVGIGTATPLVALDVFGSVRASLSSTADGVIVSGITGSNSSRNITLRPVTTGLTSSRTLSLPDVTGVAAVFTTGDGAWTSYTPTLTQSVTVSKTVTRAVYCKIGRLVHAQIQLSVTSAGTSSNAILIGLPVTAAASGIMCGTMTISSSGTNVYTHGPALANTTSVFGMLSTAGNYYGINPTTALASGNVIQANLMYEAAS